MKGPSPLVPQGSFESQSGRKPHVRIAVYTILAIHVVVLGGLLILGCKREDKDAISQVPTNDPSAIVPFTNAPDPLVMATNPPAAVNTNPVPPTALVPAPGSVVTPPPDTGTPVVTEHKIKKGETFSSLSDHYHVSVKAIQAANPGVDSSKLKIDQPIKIPPPAPAGAKNGTPASAAGDSADTYVVKSGDSLSKIASDHKTTVKELQKLNNLTTTQIKVGQKLKLPPRPAPAPAPAQ
jgi:LysM repeat protein